uniref:Ig-like domain-containing protein n=1 Tax=Equus asinus TaxID=9793 RepID=A0A9L0K690_EQUAS
MAATFISFLTLSLNIAPLSAGAVDSGVTQTPRHLIKTKGQQVTLRCSPISGHPRVSWYQQALGQGPQFFFQYYMGRENGKGDIPDRFKGQQFSDYRSELNVNILELTDSALYLCASSAAQLCRVTRILCTILPALAWSNLRANRSVRTSGLQLERKTN